MPIRRVSVIGDGAMATVCAMLLESKQPRIEVTLWGPFPENILQMQNTSRNQKYLPGFDLPPGLRLTSRESEALDGTDLVLAAIPTQHVRAVWKRFAKILPAAVPILSVAKGIENETLLRPTQIIGDVLRLAKVPAHPLMALSGPSIASELARCLPATVCVAGDDAKLLEEMQNLFTTQWLRVYTNSDMLGVELAGATKNIIGLAAGIVDGLRAGFNAKSALLSRGLAEITRLGVAMGAKAETFFGIAGVGDLATTCFSPEGRNRTAGELLGKGMKLPDVLAKIEGIVEGVPTTRSVVALARKHQVEMPIAQAVHDVLFDSVDPLKAIGRLMSRALTSDKVG